MTKLNLLLFIAVTFFVLLTGCGGENYTPAITGTERIRVVKSDDIPVIPEKTTSHVSKRTAPWAWYPPKAVEKKSWKAIMIHHSATRKGNAATFDDHHRNVNHWKGIGYDFVINNGYGKSDGVVEVTFRWKEQIPGAHVGGTAGNWANKDGIGICLVGDFSKRAPSKKQMKSLTKLVSFLQKRYNIPKYKVYGHKDTPGAGITNCPGRHFPMASFKRSLHTSYASKSYK